MIKLLSAVLICVGLICSTSVQAQAEQQIKGDIQKKLGTTVKVKSVHPAPISGLYEVLVGNDIFYTDASGKYLFQGEIIELATGKNITEQRQNDLNRIKWSDLNQSNAFKTVRGNGSRQLAIFSDPNCGYCKRLEKSLQQLDNITIYTYLIPILSPDSAQKAKQIWCSADPSKTYIDWMVNGVTPNGKSDCTTPLDKNLAFAKTYGITGTPTLFFIDGSRFPGAVQITDIEKKFSSLK
ncbi:DsbC family protein [Polynucleobacter asymbioticus]|uniref:Thiol:disulfide interchange protein n=1 Tax=Polynucleobacter asymbioticus TaxID=576611 RepID=A0AAC9ITM4_9BURK|nr:DsbC family protein [Polynucleobacter asymbioticus]APB98002.1 thiol:disulfide interchange protein [Polynucleobacter asymbioticus]APC00288.1 thiol:disulfide interchange protein [Polynucleobacter asymbioticus]